ncbi:MAG: hypothetical protein R6U95_07600 [Bacteroidales bacterium]
MNKHFTRAQSSQSFCKIKIENTSFNAKISFLQNYCRAFTIIKTKSIPIIDYALN